MILNVHYAFCFKMFMSFGAHSENPNEYRLIFLKQNCCPVTLVRGSVTFLRVLFWVSWKMGVSYRPWSRTVV